MRAGRRRERAGRRGGVTTVSTLLHTLAVVLVWGFLAASLAGCGLAVRRLLARVSQSAALDEHGLVRADIWVGFAALISYLLVWNLVAPIAWYAWILPLAVGLPAAAAGAGRVTRVGWRRLSPPVTATVVVGLFWLANESLGPALDYDFGLYHLDVIEYAKRYAAIPGLANLHARLGETDAHLLYAALLDHGPLAGAGPHLVNGSLAALLLIDLGSRFSLRATAPRPPSYARTMALLLLPATVISAGIQITHRISSPNLDFSTFVLVAVGMLYLAEYAEGGAAIAALAATAALAAASATRPLYWGSTAFAIVAVAVLSRRRAQSSGFAGARGLLSLSALPALLALASSARQAVLSGYPLLPLTLGALPVDWRVPRAVMVAQNRVDDAWARVDDVAPSVVFASWDWLHWWWRDLERNSDVIVPGALVACALVALALRTDTNRRRAAAPLMVVLLPSLGTLGAWFLIAPDPRFVWAPIWLVPISICAWALPSLGQRPPLAALIAGAAAGVGLTAVERHNPLWLVPVALAGGAAAAIVISALRAQRRAAWVAQAAALAVLLAGIGADSSDGAFHIVEPSPHGTLGVALSPIPELAAIRLSSGLRVWRPAQGNQCWQALLCTPAVVVAHLRLRGEGLADGFTTHPGPPAVYTLAATRSCLRRHGIRVRPTVDFIASTAAGGAFVAELPAAAVTISFATDVSPAEAIVLGYERVAPPSARAGLRDVLMRYNNAVMLWHAPPSARDRALAVSCLG